MIFLPVITPLESSGPLRQAARISSRRRLIPRSQTGAYRLSLSVQNTPPVLSPIGNRTLSYRRYVDDTAIGDDADGDPLTYSAQALPSIQIAQKAYDLDQQLGLAQYGNSYYTNLLGAMEKYIYSANGTWYLILPDGGFYRWGGTIHTSTLIDTLSSAVLQRSHIAA